MTDTRLRPIEVMRDGDPVWQCPCCDRWDGRYFNGGRAAISRHISKHHQEEGL